MDWQQRYSILQSHLADTFCQQLFLFFYAFFVQWSITAKGPEFQLNHRCLQLYNKQAKRAWYGMWKKTLGSYCSWLNSFLKTGFAHTSILSSIYPVLALSISLCTRVALLPKEFKEL